jgi:hypothetical protein
MSSSNTSCLALEQFGGNRMYALDPDRILYGDGGQRRQRVAAEAGQCQQVGLGACAGGRIAGGKNKNEWWRRCGVPWLAADVAKPVALE